ncbi:4162_t:CDS:2 [Funneliformis caledonium]|uniref:4162_t:CDS:1 n=1 Tax=Funneliformis caledonium TaxID=1117310 RepID=A0A9N9HQ12_9GLOM|nr:4162_t:CDS:2 [Funneliformis caledonium]
MSKDPSDNLKDTSTTFTKKMKKCKQNDEQADTEEELIEKNLLKEDSLK